MDRKLLWVGCGLLAGFVFAVILTFTFKGSAPLSPTTALGQTSSTIELKKPSCAGMVVNNVNESTTTFACVAALDGDSTQQVIVGKLCNRVNQSCPAGSSQVTIINNNGTIRQVATLPF